MAWLPDYKDIIDLLKKGATVPAQEKIMELRVGALELQEENIRLKEQVKKLEEEIQLKSQLRFEGNVYWLNRGDQTQDGPYCQLCYDGEGKLIRLQQLTNNTFYRWHCYKCEKMYRR